MNFLTFLKESYKNSKAHLVLQKVIDMIDEGHVEYDKDKLDVNIGRLIKDANLYDLHLIVRKGKTDSVRLGRNKLDDDLAIVVDATVFPQRQNLHKLFAKEEIVKGFETAFHQYMKKHHEKKEHKNKTGYETGKEVNTAKNFEKNYKGLEEKIRNIMADYKAAKKKLKDQFGKSALASHKANYTAGLAALKTDMIGNSSKEFISKMMKNVDSKYGDHMDPDTKKKMISRLTSYYEHYFLDGDEEENKNNSEAKAKEASKQAATEKKPAKE